MRTPLRIAAATVTALAALGAVATPAMGGPPLGPTEIVSGGQGPIFIRVADAGTIEGDEGTNPLRFAVTLSRASAAPLEIAVKTAIVLSTTAATKGVDYEHLEDQRVFAPGTTELFVDVAVIGDTQPEGPEDEMFSLRIDDSSAGVIADGTAMGTIHDDDGEPAPEAPAAEPEPADQGGAPEGSGSSAPDPADEGSAASAGGAWPSRATREVLPSGGATPSEFSDSQPVAPIDTVVGGGAPDAAVATDEGDRTSPRSPARAVAGVALIGAGLGTFVLVALRRRSARRAG